MPRFHVPGPLSAGAELALPAGAARHVQVLRLQPGAEITLFDGSGGEWQATVLSMGRSEVRVTLCAHSDVEREAPRVVHLVVGVMASDRMDWLVEKATELGAATLQPLLAERSSLRLDGDRAVRKQAHWQAVAVSASEQCGRNRLTDVQAQQTLKAYLPALPEETHGARWVLSLDAAAQPLGAALARLAADQPVTLLSGPEGGLSPAEEAAARAAGFQPINLGARVLRAETAPLAALAALTLVSAG